MEVDYVANATNDVKDWLRSTIRKFVPVLFNIMDTHGGEDLLKHIKEPTKNFLAAEAHMRDSEERLGKEMHGLSSASDEETTMTQK